MKWIAAGSSNDVYRIDWKQNDMIAHIKRQIIALDAYWAMDRWDVERLSGDRLEQLRERFDASFWERVPVMPGALEACHALHGAGFGLVCVTALPDRFATAEAPKPAPCMR